MIVSRPTPVTERGLMMLLCLMMHDSRTARADDGCPASQDATAPLVTDFTRSKDGTGPRLDHCEWEIVTSNWGGRTESGDYSGGVVAENVIVTPEGLILRAQGNLYDGALRGRGSDGALRPDGKRTGAALRTKRKFLGGSFQACVTIPPVLGVVTAFWTFRYVEAAGTAPLNHEIDIEFPGQRDATTPPDLDHVNLTTWVGLAEAEHTTAHKALTSRASDGKFHVLRFDWVPPRPNTDGQVDFYIDNQPIASITKTVPHLAGEVWFGLWFPPVWAGEPAFDQTEMRVKWVRAGVPQHRDASHGNDLPCE